MSVQAPERPPVTEPQPPVEATVEPAGAAVGTVAAAAFCATAAAAWMAAGIFRGFLPNAAALTGALIGAGGVWASFRTKQTTLVQALIGPAALVVGAVFALPGAGGAGLPRLVGEALRTGGLGTPPVPFDAGWRLLLVVVFALLGAAAAALGISTGRPKIGVLLPVGVLAAAAVMHPPEGELLSGAVAVGLIVAALAISFGGDLAGEGVSSGAFELQRLARGGASAAALVVGVLLISRAGFLFPEPQTEPVIPPQRPETSPPSPDRVLFRVDAERPGPWRVGVLDVYDGEAWLMPPYDNSRYAEIGDDVPGSETLHATDGTHLATFTVEDLEGRTIPTIGNPLAVEADEAVEVDPRTQTLRLRDGRASRGLRYSVESPLPPSGEALSAAGAPPPDVQEFLEVPVAPNAVVTLLDEAPQNPWDRLQFVRTQFYENVIAAGAGDPVDVPPARVAELVEGAEGTPYEITAAEALLARWAGIPSRIGYGFYSGDRDGDDGAFAVHPRHGATWLEAYFDGHGWVSIVGVPPRARSTLLEDVRNPDPNILPTDQLALVVYVPVEISSALLLFEVVRWWFLRTLPVLGATFFLVWWGLPAGAKLARTWRRRRWARTVRQRIGVAYAEFRDAARDLHVGEPNDTPLRFLAATEPDAEHEELAWLVTRTLWGDLLRDLTPDDAEAAETMSRSVRSRLRRGQPLTARFLALGGRTSLREPYSLEVPNLWWRLRIRSALRLPSFAGRRLRPATVGAVVFVVAVAFSACAREDRVVEGLELGLPDRVVPAVVDGFELIREPEAEAAYERAGASSLVTEGQVFTVRRGEVAEGSVQVAAFHERGIGRERELRRGVLNTVGGGRFEVTRLGRDRVWVQRLPEQRILLWFSPGTTYYQLMVARRDFTEAEDVFARILQHRRGEAGQLVRVPSFDPRRGGEL